MAKAPNRWSHPCSGAYPFRRRVLLHPSPYTLAMAAKLM
jgi:hypothetical protein